MKQKRWSTVRLGIAGFGLCIGLTISGCDSWHSGTAPIDPPPFEAVDHQETKDNSRVTLVWADTDKLNALFSVPSLGLNQGEDWSDRVRRVVKWMTEDGVDSTLLPQGFHAVLPAGLDVRSANYEENTKLLRVDLNEKLLDVSSGMERQALEAVVWACTAFPGVDAVSMSVMGKPLVMMPNGGSPLHQPVNRSFGINLDRNGGDVREGMVWRETALEKQSADGYVYRVPVWKWSSEEETLQMMASDVPSVNHWNWE